MSYIDEMDDDSSEESRREDDMWNQMEAQDYAHYSGDNSSC